MYQISRDLAIGVTPYRPGLNSVLANNEESRLWEVR
jgi:hypothetical protein